MAGDQRINPQITEIEIGLRDLRKIKIYPLSIRDQMEMSEFVQAAITGFFNLGEADDAAFVTFILDLLKKNSTRILELVAADEVNHGDLLAEMTTVQALQLSTIIYETNFEDLVKKVKSLLDLVQPSPSRRLSQLSANDTDINSGRSTENPIETEA